MKKDGEAPVSSLWEKSIDIELTAVKDHIYKLDYIVNICYFGEYKNSIMCYF